METFVIGVVVSLGLVGSVLVGLWLWPHEGRHKKEGR